MGKLNRCGWALCRRREPGASSSDEVEEFTRRKVTTPRAPSTRPSPEVQQRQSFLSHYLHDFTPSHFLRNKAFHDTRASHIDTDELQNWSVNMVRMLVEGTSNEVSQNLRTAIRRGVPDSLKRWVLRASHDCADFLLAHPGYVATTYHAVFGTKATDFSDGIVPTFSSGFQGTEKELHNVSTPMHDKVDAAEAPKPFLHRGFTSRHSLVRSWSWNNMNDVLAAGATGSPPPSTTLRNSVLRRPSQSFEGGSCTPHELATGAAGVSYGDYREKQTKEVSRGNTLLPPVASSRALHSLLHASSGNLSGAHTLHSVTYLASLLTPEGQTLAKKILWTINWIYPDLDFAPILPSAVCLLLMYLEEDEAVVTILKLLEASNELLKNNARRPFLTFRRSEFVRLVHMAMAFCKRTLPAISDKMEELGVDLAAWFARAFEDGFSKLLPFDLYLRIMIPFFYEGAKVFTRYALALLKMAEEPLLAASSVEEASFILLFREYRDSDVDMMNDLTKLAFRFQIRSNNEPLSKFSSHDIPTPYLTRTRVQKLYRPRLQHHSAIVSDDMWEVLWRWAPANVRILDPELIFTAAKHGHSLKALARYIWDDIARPMIFLMKTDHNEVIGGFSPYPFICSDHTPPTTDLSGSFVFTLKPHIAVFRYSGATQGIMDFSFEHLAFGFQDPAIMLDADLHTGHSGASKTFGSPSLVLNNSFGDFVVLQFEIWLLS